jgi:hypothetical protein
MPGLAGQSLDYRGGKIVTGRGVQSGKRVCTPEVLAARLVGRAESLVKPDQPNQLFVSACHGWLDVAFVTNMFGQRTVG